MSLLGVADARRRMAAALTALTSARNVLSTAAAWAALAAIAGSAPAYGLTFNEAFEAARAHDAAYRGAARERDATQLGVPIARAALLPSIVFNASDSQVQGSREFPNSQNQEVRTRLDYSSPQASLQLRQSVFNYDALNALDQARAQSSVADEIYRLQGMDLMDRLATAYLQVLLSAEALRLSEIQVQSLETQALQAEQRQQRGEGTRVQSVQVQASLDVSRARSLEAKDQLELSRRQLARITGIANATVPPLPPEPTPVSVLPDRLGEWLEIGYRQSPALASRVGNVEVARIGVKRQYAGHLPRVDLVSSVSRSQSDSTNTIGQSTTLRSIGVQLTVPLFSGGGVDASIRQAEARRAQVEEDARSEREALEVDLQRHFQAVTNAVNKINAYNKAAESTLLAWKGAQRSLEMGLGTLNDVADTQTNHFAARRDLIQARIDQLVSLVRLKIRAGMPMAEVTAEIDALLTPAAPTATATPVKQP